MFLYICMEGIFKASLPQTLLNKQQAHCNTPLLTF